MAFEIDLLCKSAKVEKQWSDYLLVDAGFAHGVSHLSSCRLVGSSRRQRLSAPRYVDINVPTDEQVVADYSLPDGKHATLTYATLLNPINVYSLDCETASLCETICYACTGAACSTKTRHLTLPCELFAECWSAKKRFHLSMPLPMLKT